jgi:hypothetical protein
MKSNAVLLGTLLAFGAGLAFAPQLALAASAAAPYTNVNHANDLGNNTGDSQIDGLNKSQLNENYWPAARQPGGVPNPPYYPPQPPPR